MLIEVPLFTERLVQVTFGIKVKVPKVNQLRMVLSAFHDIREKKIAEFKDHGDTNIFGFCSVHVLPGRLPEWNECMISLARLISTRGCTAVPASCVYEILKFCGMEVMNKGKHTGAGKQSLGQGEFVFSNDCFTKNKHRISGLRKGMMTGKDSTPKAANKRKEVDHIANTAVSNKKVKVTKSGKQPQVLVPKKSSKKLVGTKTPALKTKHYTTPVTLGKKHVGRVHSVTTVAETVEAMSSSCIRQLSGMLVDGDQMDFEKAWEEYEKDTPVDDVKSIEDKGKGQEVKDDVDGGCTSAGALEKDAQLRVVPLAEDAHLWVEGVGLGFVDSVGSSYGYTDEEPDFGDSIAKMITSTCETTVNNAERNSRIDLVMREFEDEEATSQSESESESFQDFFSDN